MSRPQRRPRKNNARKRAGKKPISKLAGGGIGNNKIVWECSAKHISNLVSELARNGLGLHSVATDTQCSTLGRVLRYLGDRGLNTYEGTAAGYARLATRIQDLEADGWIIESLRENLIGPDGLFHPRIARYILVGRQQGPQDPQMPLGLGVA